MNNPPNPPAHGVQPAVLADHLMRRAVREGRYTFHFTYIHSQPTSQSTIDKTCGMMVQAGEMLTHDDTTMHYGNSITTAAYALFDVAKVDTAIQAHGEATRGAINGTGGRSGAVVVLMRAVFHLGNTLGCTNAGREVHELARHIFERSELERAQEEVMRTRG